MEHRLPMRTTRSEMTESTAKCELFTVKCKCPLTVCTMNGTPIMRVLETELDGKSELTLKIAYVDVIQSPGENYVKLEFCTPDRKLITYCKVLMEASILRSNDVVLRTTKKVISLTELDNTDLRIPFSVEHDWEICVRKEVDMMASTHVMLLFEITFLHFQETANPASEGQLMIKCFIEESRMDIQKSLVTLLDYTALTRIKINCRDDAATFNTTKELLMVRSSYFRRMFSHETMEAQSQTVNLPESKTIVSMIMQYLENGTLPETWRDDYILRHLVLAASKYEMTELHNFLDRVLGCPDVFKPSFSLLKMCVDGNCPTAQANIFPNLKKQFQNVKDWKTIREMLGGEDRIDIIHKEMFHKLMSNIQPVVSNVQLIKSAFSYGYSELESKLCSDFLQILEPVQDVTDFLAMFFLL